MLPRSRSILLGVITGVHGIQGEVKLKSFTQDPEAIADYGPLDGSNGQKLVIKSLKPHKDFFRVRLEGVNDRNTAETLRGVELSILREQLPQPDDDEIYHADLIGLSVLDQEQNLLGKVEGILDFGAGELLEYRLEDASGTQLIPFNLDTVPEIDLDAGTLTVRLPEEITSEDS
ncbi:MAG: ribosome maturation factor RimM [Anderseniella sp.]